MLIKKIYFNYVIIVEHKVNVSELAKVTLNSFSINHG